MRVGILAYSLLCLVLSISKYSFGEEIELPPNGGFEAYQASTKKAEAEKVQVFIPLTMQPVKTQTGVYQQILNHQLHQMQAYGIPTQKLEQWNGQVSMKRTTASTETGAMSFQVQPITTQGTLNMQNIGRLSIHHQMFLHQTEYRLTPAHSRWSLSHVDTPDDSRNRLMYGWEW